MEAVSYTYVPGESQTRNATGNFTLPTYGMGVSRSTGVIYTPGESQARSLYHGPASEPQPAILPPRAKYLEESANPQPAILPPRPKYLEQSPNPEHAIVTHLGSSTFVSDASCPRLGIPPKDYEVSSHRIQDTSGRATKQFFSTRKRRSFQLYGKRWYFRLVPPRGQTMKRRARALLQDYSLDQVAGHLVVCFEIVRDHYRDYFDYEEEEKKTSRMYAYFDTYLEFRLYQKNFPPEQRCFYEVIFGEYPQKPHFDIDMSLEDLVANYPGRDLETSADSLKDSVIKALLEIIPEISLERDIMLFSSHGETKRSFHIVVANHCHSDNKEASTLHRKVVERLSEFQQFVDPAVYSPRQQFRIVGCEKPGSGRPKRFQRNFLFEGREVTHRYHEESRNEDHSEAILLLESLVSFTTMCSYLPSFCSHEDHPVKKNYDDLLDISQETVDSAVTLLKKQTDNAFEVKEVQGSMISLKRLRPSHCIICNRVHECDNSFIVVGNSQVYWYCHRAKGRRVLVGSLPVVVTQVITEQEEEIDETEEEGVFNFGQFQLRETEGSTHALSRSESSSLDSQIQHPKPPTPSKLTKNVRQRLIEVEQQSYQHRAIKNWAAKRSSDLFAIYSAAGKCCSADAWNPN